MAKDDSLERLLALEDMVARIGSHARKLEIRQSQIIGVLVSGGLWPVNPETGRTLAGVERCGKKHPGDETVICARVPKHEGPHRGLAPTELDPNGLAEWPARGGGSERAQRACGYCGKWHPDEAPPCERFAANEARNGRDAHASGHPDNASDPAVGEGSRTTGRVTEYDLTRKGFELPKEEPQPAARGLRRNPEVRQDPPRWKGDKYKGKRFSETTSEYLVALASFLDWCADRAAAQREVTSNGALKAPYILDDAKLAREWSLELGRREDAARGRK